MLNLRGRALAIFVVLAIAVAGCSNDDNSLMFSGAPPSAGGPAAVTPISGQLVFAQDGALFRVDREGGNLAALTSGAGDSEPSIHPGGSPIVFSRRLPEGAQDVFTIAADGTGATNLTPGFDREAFSPNYSLDGTRIVFSARLSASQQNIYVMNADGSGLSALTDQATVDTRPAFSSNGQFVVFERAVGANSRICKVPVAGGPALDLTDGTHRDLHPSYRAPQDIVLFARDGDLTTMDDDHLASDSGGFESLDLAEFEAAHPDHSPESSFIYFAAVSRASAQQSDGSTGTAIYRALPDGSDVQKLIDQPSNLEGLAVGALTSQVAPPNQVTVEVVNDSGLTDDKVFMLLSTPQTTGQIVQGPPTLQTGNGQTSATGVALSTLNPLPNKAKSPFTGEDRSVYSFLVQNLVSGQVNFSYNTPVSILNGAAPTSTTPYRYDKMEITYESSIQGGGGNLTSIDFYGIPLQVEVFHDGQVTPDALWTKTFYASTPTLLKTLAAMSGDMASGAGWTKSTSGGTFDPQSNDFSNFARILSPNTIAAADTPQARPFPYPSMEGYLKTLVGKSFQFNGSQHGGYRYTATVQNDGNGGFDVVCVGTTTQTPAGPPPNVPQVGPNATVTVHLPKGQAGPASDPARSMDFFIYACVANQYSYSVSGYPFTGSNQTDINNKVGYVNSTAYGSLVGDVQAALNFGYPDSKWVPTGGDVDALFGTPVVLPYPYPYGGARVSNDGFYNPYAGLLYYLSDAYGHPFSDRLDAASPLYKLAAGDRVRITILPDVRLDAPLVKVTGQTENSLALSWKAVDGATGYRVNVSPETVDTQSVPATAGVVTHTVPNLLPGVPYLVSVTATGSRGGTEIASTQVSVQGTTTGTRALLAGGPIKFEMNAGLPNDLSNLADLQAYINGSPVGPTANAQISGNFGVNVVDFKIISKSTGAVLQRGNYFLEFISKNPANTMFGLGRLFTLQYNLTPLSVAPPNDSYPLEGNGMVVGTPFTPKPYYEFYETVFPGK